MQKTIERLTPKGKFPLLRKVAIFLSFGLGACLWLAQVSPAPPARAEAYLHQGNQLWVMGAYDSAFSAYQQAQRLAPDRSTWAQATFLMGKYLSRHARFEEGAAHLDSVLALQDKLGMQHGTMMLARNEYVHLFRFQGEMDTALHLIRALVADTESLAPEADSLRATALTSLGIVFISMGQLKEAIEPVQEGLKIRKRIYPPDHLEIAYTENTLGTIFTWLDQYEQALAHMLRTEAIFAQHFKPNHPQWAQVRSNIAVQYAGLGLFWRALNYHEANLPYLDRLPPMSQLSSLVNHGAMLKVVGDYQEALDIFAKAERLARQYPDMIPGAQAMMYEEKSGVLMALGHGTEALDFAEKSLAINQGVHGADHGSAVPKMLVKANVLKELNRLEEAIVTYQQAIALADRHLIEAAVHRGEAWEFLGETLALKGDNTEAIQAFQNALTVYLQSGSAWHAADPLYKMALLHQQADDWSKALALHEQAWAVALPEIPFQLAPDSSVWAYWNRIQLSGLLDAQAQNLQAQYRNSGEQQYLEAAFAAYRSLIAVKDSQRHYYAALESKQFTVADQQPIYEAALEMAFELHQLSQDPAYLLQAFRLADRAKANALRDHLQDRQALHFSGIPDSVLAQERDFRYQFASLDQARFEPEADSATLAEIADKRFRQQQAYRHFIRQLETHHPRYYQLKYPHEAVSLLALGENLEPDQALYSYWWGQEAVFVFRYYQQQLSMYRLRQDSLAASLDKWLSFVSQRPDEQSMAENELPREALLLKEHLLPGLPAKGSHLLLAPHGKLSYLPFESLLTHVPESHDYRHWPYLVHDYRSYYANSLELWQRLSSNFPQQEAVAYLGFAPSFSGAQARDSRFSPGPLKYNQQEVQQVARSLAGKAYVGTAAREAVIKQLGRNPVLLHFATHALITADNPLRSRLLCYPDSLSGEDGRLHAYEIYELEFNSPLTVLSACQTGWGHIQQGEGVMSLARAFQYAGSRRVLTTLWEVADRAGADLTTTFFEGIKQGEAVEVSLQQARVQWLTQSDSYHCHPYFWASFVLIGDGGRIDFDPATPTYWLWWCGGGLLLLLISFGVYRQRRAQSDVSSTTP